MSVRSDNPITDSNIYAAVEDVLASSEMQKLHTLLQTSLTHLPTSSYDYNEHINKVISMFSDSVKGAVHRNNKKRKSSTFRSNKWYSLEDARLKTAVEKYGRKWKLISEFVGTRNSTQCRHRWTKTLAPGIIKGRWKKHEDDLLKGMKMIDSSWKDITKAIVGRSEQQCRERWEKCLNPLLKKKNWSLEEDTIIISTQSKIGNNWSTIAKSLTQRTAQDIRNRFRALQSRKVV